MSNFINNVKHCYTHKYRSKNNFHNLCKLLLALASNTHYLIFQNRYMYWSEWGKSQSIKKAALDGSRQTSFSPTRGQATSLTLDESDRRLYWVEINTGTIMSSDLDGNDRTAVVRNLVRPIGLALYKDRLYWSAGEGGTIIFFYQSSSRVNYFFIFRRNISDVQKPGGNNGKNIFVARQRNRSVSISRNEAERLESVFH